MKQLGRRTKIFVVSIIMITFILCYMSKLCFVSDDLYDIQFTTKVTNIKDKVLEMKNKTRVENKIVKSFSNPIRILKTPTYKCNFPETLHKTLLIVVKSYIGNFDQRLAIRETWGNESGGRVQIVFFVGEQPYANDLLEDEERLYHDIVQGSFEDKYENIIWKTMMTYKWIVEYCANVNYVLFVDDDCMVNIEKILDAIDKKDTFDNRFAMYGHRFTFAMPFRDQASKYYVPYTKYRGFYYPPFLSGTAIITHINVIEEFSIAFPFVKHFNIDDVFLGIIAKLLDIPLFHDDRFSIHYVTPVRMKGYFSSHEYRERGSIIKGWQELHEH